MKKIVLTIILLSGFIIGYLSYEKENQEDMVSTSIEETISLEEAESLYQLLHTDFLDDYFYIEDRKAETLSYAMKYQIAFAYLDSKGIHVTEENNNEFSFKISEETFQDAFITSLGKNTTYSKTQTSSEFIAYTKWTFQDLEFEGDLEDLESYEFSGLFSNVHYDSQEKAIVGTLSPEGSSGSSLAWKYSKIESYTKKNKEITIIEKVVFISYDDEIDIYEDTFSYQVCKDIECKNILDTVENANIENDYQKISIDKYIEKASTVTYTFEEQEDGTYSFVSSKFVQ